MVITYITQSDLEKARGLATELGFTLRDSVAVDYSEYYLSVEDGNLLIRDLRQGSKFSIQLDIKKELNLLRKQKISLKKDLLARAVGYKGQENYKVFDGTLGAGKDSIHLLHFGCQVIASEADPVAYAIVRDAMLSLTEDLPFEILLGDTDQNIGNYCEQVNCLYMDPMFEDLKKKSAPKKAMAFLRDRNISSKSVYEVIDSAIAQGIKRIVVKRPIKGKQLYPEPTMSIAGKLVRYDVYIR